MVGVLSVSSDPSIPLSSGLVVAPLVWMSWQEMQARDPSADNRGSAKSRSPRASFRGSTAGGAGTGVIGSCSAGPVRLDVGASGTAAPIVVRTKTSARQLTATCPTRIGSQGIRGCLRAELTAPPSPPIGAISSELDFVAGNSNVLQYSGRRASPNPLQDAGFRVRAFFSTTVRL